MTSNLLQRDLQISLLNQMISMNIMLEKSNVPLFLLFYALPWIN